MVDQAVLGVVDYVIVALAMVGSLAIGLYFRYYGGKQKSNEEYLLAGKNMSLIPVGISLMSSFISAITVLGNASETYSYGLMYILTSVGSLIAIPIIIFLYLPVFFNLNITSTYEYLDMRFGPIIRVLVSLCYTAQMLLYNGIVLYTPSIALEAVVGLNKYLSIILVGIVSMIYSTLGGMKAVVWTDSLQSSLMVISIILTIVFCSIEVDGIQNLFTYARNGGRLDFTAVSLDPTIRHTWWTLTFGGMFTYLSLFAVNHTQIVRYKALPTLKIARIALIMSSLMIMAASILSSIAGVAIYAVYKDCDPGSVDYISAYDQILPYFVMQFMSHIPGLAGLFVAGLLSASLSTLSSACNGLAGVLVEDYLSKWVKPRVLWSKIAVFVYSIVIIGVAFIAENLGGLIEATLKIFGAIGGPVLAVFSLGIFTRFNNENGAIVGLLSGLAFNFWISMGGPRPSAERLAFSTGDCPAEDIINFNSTAATVDESSQSNYFYLYRLSYQIFSVTGFFWTFIVGSVVSFLWKKKQPWEVNGDKFPNPGLFCPPLAKVIEKEKDLEHSKIKEHNNEIKTKL